MKLEDIKDQESLDKFLEDKINEATSGLSNKNTELMDELKGMKRKFGDVDLDKLMAAQKKLEELETKGLEEQGEYKKLLEKQSQQHQSEIEKMQKQLEMKDATLRKKLVHDDLATALSKANVKPVLAEAAIALLTPEVSIIEQDGEYIARVGEKTIADHIKDWGESDVGKNFIQAQQNTGGGANGSGSGGAKSDDYEPFFTKEGYNLTKQAELYKIDPKRYNQLKEKHSRSANGSGAAQASGGARI